ncbi:hypothetical protein [Pseudarthrobacter sulfonivorans]|uniref:hypothetical protein n=1 Tax=Pseudarthrobacter sulfonivorans TaxID=121292 RepID=UPI0028637854|nr:hypothetical protein [Pseudarthrobacter sulfonivorans]MDR6416822.1 hypothetical protein [Pseudarthrobacter sulfonivorans]
MSAFRARLRIRTAVLLLSLAVILTGCAGAPDDAQTAKPLEPGRFSTLDAAGVDQIRQTKIARLDMSSGRLEKAAVGVAQASYGPEINTRNSGKISLTIVAPSGEIRGETDRIRFNTTDKREDFSEVTYFLTASSLDEFASLIRDGVERYGIDSVVAERWISSMERDPEDKSDYSVTSGTSTGLEVNYDLRYDGTKDIQVIIVHVWPLD